MKKIMDYPKSWMIPVKEYDDGVKSYQDHGNDRWEAILTGNSKEENFVFEAILVPDGTYRGRSAAGMFFKDADDGTLFSMSLTNINHLLKGMYSGKIKQTDDGFKGVFTFEKKGMNYSLTTYEGNY